MNDDDSAADEPLPLGEVFFAIGEKFSLEVVREALRFRQQASPSARDRFNARLRKLKVSGFRDASRAPPVQLEDPVLDAVVAYGDDRMAGAVLGCWQEANAPLRDAVAAHLAEEGIPLLEGPLRDEFVSTWDEDSWFAQRTKVVEADDKLSPEGVGLMLMLLTGKRAVPKGGLPQPINSSRFLRWLDELEALPSTSSDWHDARAFADHVLRMCGRKDAEFVESVVSRVEADAQRILEAYAEELAYLDIDAQILNVRDGRASSTMVALIQDLGDALKAYQPVRPQASSRAEELKRIEARLRHEEEILDIVKRLVALPVHPQPGDAEQTPDEADDEGPDDADAPAPGEIERLTRELGETRAELQRAETSGAELREEIQRIQEHVEGMRLSREQRDAEMGQLRSELADSRLAEEHWRLAYVAACKARPSEEGVPQEVASVKDAVARAEQAFPDKLLFALNGKSDLDVPFAKPAEVFDALAWLGTCYRRDGVPSIGETCPGWFFKPEQTESTMGKYREWYETSAGGRTFRVSSHVGKGSSFDPRRTIRIGFAWDDEHSRVVVGFVGRHQRTGAS